MYTHILVPIDGSDTAGRGLQEAMGVAREMRARLFVLHVVTEIGAAAGSVAVLNDGQVLDLMMRNGHELVQEALRAVRAEGLPADGAVVDAEGRSACDVIVQQAVARGCDLIVMGTQGRRGLKRLTLGSNAEMVVRRATVPVLLVKAQVPGD